MKAIVTFASNRRMVLDIVKPPPRKERETWGEYEMRILRGLEESFDAIIDDVVRVHIMRR